MKSVTSKMISIILIISIAGLAIVITISSVILSNSLVSESLEKINQNTAKDTARIDGWLEKQSAHISALAEDMYFILGDLNEKTGEVLSKHIELNPQFFEFYVGNPDGTGTFGSGWIPDYAGGWTSYKRGWYINAAEKNKSVIITTPYTDSQTGKLCTTIAKTIVDPDGQIIGVAAGDMFVDTLEAIVNKTDLGNESFAFILDGDGNILMHPDDKYAPVNDIFQNISSIDGGIYKEMWEKTAMDGNSVKFKGNDRVAYYYTAYSIPSADWRFYTAAPVSVVNAPVYTVILIIIPVSVVIMGILIVVSVFVVRFIDKILTNSVSELKAASFEILSAANELSETSGTLAESGTVQAASIEETSASVNETSGMVEANNRNTRHALTLTKETAKETSVGMDKVKQLTESMMELSESGNEIAKIISAISAIAAQTNILALNASVESARAGESGRAFSVVSEEVRSLAQRCDEAVKTTTSIIEKNSSLTVRGMESSKEIKSVFEIITGKVVIIEQLISEMAMASEEQLRGVNYINQALTQMEKASQSNAAVAMESASTAATLKSQSTKLSGLTESMNVLVGQKEDIVKH